jgi:hypothetical protein
MMSNINLHENDKYPSFADLNLCTKWILEANSQNQNAESNSLIRWAQEFQCHKSFVEFGFEPFEYNSIGLTKLNYSGLILDGSSDNCQTANFIFKNLNFNTKAINQWIDLDSLDPIIDFYHENNNNLGVLNVDIDGNDYWILKELLKTIKPDLICVEHNASFGIRPITIPYIQDFNRHDYHKSGLYHGASITAFDNLLNKDYYLVENIAGLNLIFLKKENLIKCGSIYALDVIKSHAEPVLRNKWSSSTTETQWEKIKNMPFVEVR